MHCGGSADGLEKIKVRKVFDANEFSRGAYYWRDPSRDAPDNLYTGGEKWRKYFTDYGGAQEFGAWQGWSFGNLPATGTEKISYTRITYGARFIVEWRYNATSSLFERYHGGDIFLDDENNPIAADNIVIQYADVSVIDAVGRRKIVTVSDGDDARVISHGRLVRGTWKKENLSSRTRFYTDAGEEILLPPGRTWVMIVPQKTLVEFGS
jgi:hypothetical protein